MVYNFIFFSVFDIVNLGKSEGGVVFCPLVSTSSIDGFSCGSPLLITAWEDISCFRRTSEARVFFGCDFSPGQCVLV